MNYSLNSKDLGKESDGGKDYAVGGSADDSSANMFGESLLNSRQSINRGEEEDTVKKAKLFNTSMPWDLRFRYALTYNNVAARDEITTNSLQVSGNLEFSPKWKVGFSTGYDFRDNGITYTQLRFERDLDSWRFSFNWVPFGDRATYYFYIGIKSGALSDLKYDQRRVPDRRLF